MGPPPTPKKDAIKHKKSNEKVIKTVFTIVVAAVAAVNFYNAVA